MGLVTMQEQPQPSQQSVQDYYWESGSSSDAHHSSQPTVEDNAAANLLAMSKPTRCMDGTATHPHEVEHQAQVAFLYLKCQCSLWLTA